MKKENGDFDSVLVHIVFLLTHVRTNYKWTNHVRHVFKRLGIRGCKVWLEIAFNNQQFITSSPSSNPKGIRLDLTSL